MQVPENYTPTPTCLNNKIILITGAGGGIGRVAAKTFAAHGATIILVGRTLAKLEVVYDEIEAAGHPQPAIFVMNFESAKELQFSEMCDAIFQEFGHIDGLLHNAADLGQTTSLANYSADVWQRCMHVNVNAPFMLTKALIPLMQRTEHASGLFTGSSVGYKGRAYWGAYAASKAAAENLMQTFSEECEETTNIRFNSINPGATRTPMRAAAYPGEDPTTVKMPEALMRDYLYLIGDASVGITGKQFESSATQ